MQALPEAPLGTAILNLDDPGLSLWPAKPRLGSSSTVFDPKADLWADHIVSQGLAGIRFHLHYQGESFPTHAPVIGQHSIHTVLSTVSAALIEGMPMPEIINALQRAGNQLRLVTVNTRQGALLLDDTYNASPESTLAALNLLHELPGRKIAVLGGILN